MNLHQLVSLRNQLKHSLDISIIKNEIEKNFLRLQDLTQNIDFEVAKNILDLTSQHKSHIDLFYQDINTLESIINDVQQKINNFSNQFFAENYQFELQPVSAEFIRQHRTITFDENFCSEIIKRIHLNSNWQFPALEIGARDGEYTKYLVASDPFYISDFYDEFLDSALEQFDPAYRGRVHKRIIKDFIKIDNLPKNQLGLIFSYNFFNYLSLDSIKQLLIQSFEWLRPGGKIIFTYNNADLPAGAAYAENYFMTYVPKRILIPMAESLGYETVYSFDLDPAYALIEFKKPGQLKSIKAAQVLGEIKVKHI